MHDKIEKMKQGKLNPNELLKSISMETGQNVSVVKHEKVTVEKAEKQNPNKSFEYKRKANVQIAQKK